MSFNKKNYLVVKNLVSKELCSFLTEYLILKKQVAKIVIDNGLIIPKYPFFGTFNDGQVKNAYSHYADIAFEILLKNLKPKIEKIIKLKLTETYSYLRIYEQGNVLERHLDRESCEISLTLNLGGDLWPIFIDPSKKKDKKGISINLKPGDVLIYRGCKLEHWRNAFKGKMCAQAFFHYNENNKNLYDGRSILGLQKGI